MDETLKSEIFTSVKALLEPYADQLEVRGKKENQYHLYGRKEVKFPHKIEKGMYFASAMINKGFVGFYFFPIYTHPDKFQNLDEKLLKCLKGKSCFHIKKNDDNLMQSIKKALAQGFDLYKQVEYV